MSSDVKAGQLEIASCGQGGGCHCCGAEHHGEAHQMVELDVAADGEAVRDVLIGPRFVWASILVFLAPLFLVLACVFVLGHELGELKSLTVGLAVATVGLLPVWFVMRNPS